MASYTRTVQIPGKTSQQLYDRISSEIDSFLSKTSIGKYTLERDPDKKEVRFQSSMASASLLCGEEKIDLTAKLSLFASPFRAKLDEGIDRWISKTFG
jgi:hypothetical protein